MKFFHVNMNFSYQLINLIQMFCVLLVSTHIVSFPALMATLFSFRPKAKTPPQDILLKLQKEQNFKELSQESSIFVLKLGLSKLQCCLLMNGLVFDTNEVQLKILPAIFFSLQLINAISF